MKSKVYRKIYVQRYFLSESLRESQDMCVKQKVHRAMHDDLGSKNLEIHKYNLEKTQQKFEKLTETSQEIHKDN